MFLIGYKVDGGFSGMVMELNTLDPTGGLTSSLSLTNPIFNSTWDIFAIFFAHLPLGLLPHVGNKLWALKNDADQKKFITIAFIFGMILPAITCGGILARAILGDALLLEGANPNHAIPELFIATLPAWVAALICSGVLAAVMSTADGLVVSTAQIFANDIFRRTIAPKYMQKTSDARIDKIGLYISRIATVLVLIVAIWIAWSTREMNVALLVWIGIGGMMAATAAPMFLGVLWKGATRVGALSGFVAGGLVFSLMHGVGFDASWLGNGHLEIVGTFLEEQKINPFACATIGGLCSIVTMYLVSQVTEKPSEEHIKRVFGES